MKAEFKKRHLDNVFFDSLSGDLKNLLDLIKKDDTLRLCFRGQYASVYYRGDSLYKIEPLTNCYKISFDFNHSRYTSNVDDQLGKLEALGYEYSEGKGEKEKKSRKVVCKYPPHNMKINSSVFWGESSKILKSLIDDFLDIEKKYDYFKKENKNGKGCHLERERQQDIMRVNNTLKGEYFIYDMEYDQPRNSFQEDKSGRFDMLALRRTSKGHYNLVFLELKSTTAACSGKSDIEKHDKDLKTYIGKGDIVKVRIDDALKICQHYISLGLVEKESVQVDGVEILFVFTDEARKCADKIKDTKKKCILLPWNLKLKYNKGAS